MLEEAKRWAFPHTYEVMERLSRHREEPENEGPPPTAQQLVEALQEDLKPWWGGEGERERARRLRRALRRRT